MHQTSVRARSSEARCPRWDARPTLRSAATTNRTIRASLSRRKWRLPAPRSTPTSALLAAICGVSNHFEGPRLRYRSLSVVFSEFAKRKSAGRRRSACRPADLRRNQTAVMRPGAVSSPAPPSPRPGVVSRSPSAAERARACRGDTSPPRAPYRCLQAA